MKKPKIVVVGSTIMDMGARTEHLPQAGYTVIGKDFYMSPGGKGANQAVACSRLGADTCLLSAVGTDTIGDTLIQSIRKYGVDTQHSKQVKNSPSGTALIVINNKGENQICAVLGANMQLTPQDIRNKKSVFEKADMVLLQLEIPFETVCETVKLASARNIPVILNPAPAGKLDKMIYKYISYLTPNEYEAAHYVGKQNPTQKTIESSAKYFHNLGVPHVIVTLGKNGAAYFSKQESYRVKAPKVNALDSVGAGDAFNAGLAVALTLGKSIKEAIKFANYVGALSVTRPGAQQAMPTHQEVLKFIAKSSNSR